jgi:hypothetical protein
MDIPTGAYVIGQRGESIFNGGLAATTMFCSEPNAGKTVLTHHNALTVVKRYVSSEYLVFETESSPAGSARPTSLAKSMNALPPDQALHDSPRFKYTDKLMYACSEMWAMIKQHSKERHVTKKEYIELPMLDEFGKPVKSLTPMIFAIDSLSMFQLDNVINKVEATNAGDKEQNMLAMDDARSKTSMISEMTTIAPRGGICVIMTAHMGKGYSLDPYAPKTKQLAFLKGDITFKNVPEKARFLINNVWYIMGVAPLRNQTTKSVEFPRDSKDDLKNDSDLMLAAVVSLRTKTGSTGIPFDIIYSQSQGVCVGLTEFYYCRTFKFGIGGHDKSYYMEIYPEAILTRTTIRRKIDEDPKLQRAMEITSEMCQINNLWHTMSKGWMCTPKELYDDLKAKGYDWDVLLATRGYWTHDQYTHPVPFLSTGDLLNMRAGTYHPYWMPPLAVK